MKSKPYWEIVEEWVRDFYASIDDVDDEIEVGNRSGIQPDGVKIIFDGYGEDDDGEPDYNSLSFAVFVHKDSLTQEFPEHDFTPWCVIQRPNEEVCIYVWFDLFEDNVEVISFKDSDTTNLDHDFVEKLISDIYERDKAKMG